MAAILAAAAVAVDTQPGQALYLGPMVNLTLNDETCPPIGDGDVLMLDEGLIEEQPRGDYLVIPNECDTSGYFSDHYLDANIDSWRWQTQALDRIACNCRNDYPAWLTLRGPDVSNQGICDSYETAYGWLYGEPSETIKWMTVPPQYNISIPNGYSGQQFQNPDPNSKRKTLICNSTNIIQKANQCVPRRRGSPDTPLTLPQMLPQQRVRGNADPDQPGHPERDRGAVPERVRSQLRLSDRLLRQRHHRGRRSRLVCQTGHFLCGATLFIFCGRGPAFSDCRF